MKIKQEINNFLNILNLINIKPYKKKINEKYMNNNQIKHFKKIILILYKKITLNKKKKNNIINLPNIIKKLTEKIKFNNKFINKHKKKNIIKKLKNTIKKIKKGNFGYCNKCNNKIGIKTLEKKPTENLCINCKIEFEIKKKLY